MKFNKENEKNECDTQNLIFFFFLARSKLPLQQRYAWDMKFNKDDENMNAIPRI